MLAPPRPRPGRRRGFALLASCFRCETHTFVVQSGINELAFARAPLFTSNLLFHARSLQEKVTRPWYKQPVSLGSYSMFSLPLSPTVPWDSCAHLLKTSVFVSNRLFLGGSSFFFFFFSFSSTNILIPPIRLFIQSFVVKPFNLGSKGPLENIAGVRR